MVGLLCREYPKLYFYPLVKYYNMHEMLRHIYERFTKSSYTLSVIEVFKKSSAGNSYMYIKRIITAQPALISKKLINN